MRRATSWCWCSAVLLGLLAPPAASQGLGLGGLTALAEDHSSAGPRGEVIVHPADRARLVAAAAGLWGLSGGRGAGVRVEALAQFHLTPFQPAGWGVYGAGGLAYLAQEGASGAALLVVLVGAERAPAGRRSWFLEVGLGGGVRLVLGARWRPGSRR